MSSQVAVSPVRGDVWQVNFGKTEGHEQAGIRPAVVLSTTLFNQSPAQLAVVVPVSGTDRKIPIHIRIHPPEGGLDRESFAMCDQIRTVSTAVRFLRRYGSVAASTLSSIEYAVKVILGL